MAILPAICAVFITLLATVARPRLSDFGLGAAVGVFVGISIVSVAVAAISFRQARR